MQTPVLEQYRQRLGLKSSLLREWMALDSSGRPWRVASVERSLCELVALDDGGRLLEMRALVPAFPIAVGDWVQLAAAAGAAEPSGFATVAQRLERATVLERGSVKREGQVQLIAANVDTVFIVAAFASDPKLEQRALRARRLDRFISAVKGGGATPVVLLNKVDMSEIDAPGLEALCLDMTSRLGGVEVACVSAAQRRGLQVFDPWLTPGETVAFIGQSGVGKSSLVNALFQGDRQQVGEVRAGDTKGRHTTTRRQLLMLPSGALIIDTPGMREFAVLADSSSAGFEDITRLAQSCRFANCSHGVEPDCAVRDALSRGDLPLERVDSYLDIEREAQRLRAKEDPHAQQLERASERRFSRVVRESQKRRRRP